jgi:hypothetical protein
MPIMTTSIKNTNHVTPCLTKSGLRLIKRYRQIISDDDVFRIELVKVREYFETF